MARNPSRTAPAHLDEVSRRIIEQLERDGRRSYAAIGKEVELSEAAVRQRVQKLLDSGVIEIVAVTDPAHLGLLRRATVGVRVSGEPEPVAEQLAAFDEVARVVVCAGTYDLLVDITCAGDDELRDLLSRRFRKIDGVAGTETFLHLDTVTGTRR